MLSLVHEIRSERVIYLPRIHEHIPPPHIRKSKDQTKIRTRRCRAHKAGDHSLCIEDNCPELATVTDLVTRHVTRNDGTGRGGTGKAAPKAQGGTS